MHRTKLSSKWFHTRHLNTNTTTYARTWIQPQATRGVTKLLPHPHFPKLYDLLRDDSQEARSKLYTMIETVNFDTAENRKPRYAGIKLKNVQVRRSAVLMCFVLNRTFMSPDQLPPVKLLILQKQPKNATRNAQYIYGGQPCFPGGTFQEGLDQHLKDTAIRESIEEIGEMRMLKIVNETIPESLTGAGTFEVKPFIATFERTDDDLFHLQHNEIAHAFEVDLRTVLDAYEKNGVIDNPGYGKFHGPLFHIASNTSPTVENPYLESQPFVELMVWGYTSSIIEKFCHTIERAL